MKSKTLNRILLFLLIMSFWSNYSQIPGNQNDTGNLEDITEDDSGTPGEENDTGDLEDEDRPAASIDRYLIPLALSGFYFSYRLLKKTDN